LKRDSRIDSLRALAIVLIILAHVYPPTVLFQIRIFDVPLMAMLLGMSFILSVSKKNKETYINFVLKRFKRLVIPAWVFLTLFFICSFTAVNILNIKSPYDLKTLITSYSLLSGIGYVWIIRVFFTIAILSPLLFKLSKKINTLLERGIVTFSLLFIQELLCILTEKLYGVNQYLFEQLVAISFGYAIIALVGMWAINQTRRENLISGCFFLTIFLATGKLQGFPLISDQKYPPTIYFLSFGLGISLFLFYLVSNKVLNPVLENEIIVWVSKHSLEIYYWHIFPITMFELLLPNINWLMKFIITLIITGAITILQTKYLPHFFNLRFINLKHD
jgi:peptidoglycan/LPS O-acetylase OafA/YrhL